MIPLNPPPQQIPKTILSDTSARKFFTQLLRSVYQIWYSIGGQSGIPTIFQVTDTPTVDPGWSTSSTVDMNPPSGYIKILVDGDEKVIPFFDT